VTTTAAGNGARFAAQPIEGGGTSAADWCGWGREFPAVDLAECPALIVVAPHPDDETLGFGATASTLRSRGVDVRVVSVSDGGGAVPGLSPLERTWLERDRRKELRLATQTLGLGEPICLGLPDGELSACEDELARLLADLVASGPKGTWCAATWCGDGHPDHEAVGRAAAAAVERTDSTLLEYPVWMWHWARPDDADVPWHRMSMSPVDRAATARKRRAATAFVTQLRPYEQGMDATLPPFVIQRLFAVGEAVFR
jgi:LmbE family N-acetylglucosaminyl deacetylase